MLTVITMLYITSPRPINHITERKFVPLTPLTHFTHKLQTPWQSPISSFNKDLGIWAF